VRRALVLAALLLLVPVAALAQPAALRTAPKGATPQGFPTAASVDANITALDVFIRGGAGSGGTSATDNTAFTGGSSSLTPGGALYDTTPPAITDGNVGIFRMNASRVLMMDCVSGCSGSSFADSTAFTFGGTSISIMGAVVDDTGTNTVAENSAGAPRMSTNRVLYSFLTDSTGAAVGTAGAPLRIDPTGTTTQPVSGTVTANVGTTGGLLLDATFTGRLPAAAALADNVANPTTTVIGSYLVGYNRINDDWDRVTVSRTNGDGLTQHASGNLVTQSRIVFFNGTTFDRARGDITNGLDVDVTRVQGTVTVDGTVRTNTGATATRTQVSDTTTDSQLLASNANRRGATIYNDSSGTLLIGLGTTTVTSTNYSARVFTEGHYTVPEGFTGEIRGLWLTDPNDGAARISELTP
jgi:hypothetical protein